MLLAARPWLADLPEPLRAVQRRAQERDHAARVGLDGHRVLEVDGAPVGRVWAGLEEGAVLVLDLTLLPAARGRGTGRSVAAANRLLTLGRLLATAAGGLALPVRVEALLADARAAGAPLRVSVAWDDAAARAFWRRLGLRQTGPDPVRLQLEAQ